VSTSEFHRWITFAWQRGTVVYMVSAQDSGSLEAAVNAFPY
jgi:tRNA threonylcarbamoyladenosine modification (KEOPS) complex  Pcc1 subunit